MAGQPTGVATRAGSVTPALNDQFEAECASPLGGRAAPANHHFQPDTWRHCAFGPTTFLEVTITATDRVHVCECGSHSFCDDTSGMYTLLVPPKRKRLLQDVGWSVGPVNKGSKRLQARANSNAPGVQRKQLLHRVVTRAAADRRVRAMDGNLLNATPDNLQTCSRSDIAILNRRGEPNKLVGVTYQEPPRWLKTEKRWSASIKVDGVAVHLGSWKSANEAAAAFDRAARVLYGKGATTNESLGLIPRRVAMTKVCRMASRQARNRVRDHREKVFEERLPAYLASKPTFESLAALTKRPTEQPVEVQCFNTGRVVCAKSEVEKAADAKREKRERRAARKAQKVAKAMVMQRRRERAAAAMAEMDADPGH
jgi:hypothetical protein